MTRVVLGVIAGFVSWLIVWVGSEMILSVISPEGYGVHQLAFQAAIENGGPFTANTRLLLIQIALGSIVSVTSGFLAALVAGENKRTPLVLGLLLVALGVMKAVTVLAVCSPVVSLHLYGGSISNDDHGR